MQSIYLDANIFGLLMTLGIFGKRAKGWQLNEIDDPFRFIKNAE